MQALISALYRHMYLYVLLVSLIFESLLHYILNALPSFSKNGCSFINDDLSFLLFWLTTNLQHFPHKWRYHGRVSVHVQTLTWVFWLLINTLWGCLYDRHSELLATLSVPKQQPTNHTWFMVSCWELYSQNSFYEKLMVTVNYEWERLCDASRNWQVTKFRSTCQHEVSYLKHKQGSDF